MPLKPSSLILKISKTNLEIQKQEDVENMRKLFELSQGIHVEWSRPNDPSRANQ